MEEFHRSNYFPSFNIKQVLIKELTNISQLENNHFSAWSLLLIGLFFFCRTVDFPKQYFCHTEVMRMLWRYINVYIALDYKTVEWIELPLCIEYAHSAQIWSGWVVYSSESRCLDSSHILQKVPNAAARNIFLDSDYFISDSKLLRTFSHTILNQIFIPLLL